MATAPAAQFNQLFRQEHCAVRDALLDLIGALDGRDLPRARALLDQLIALTGPHFRYEEEALYPALVDIYGEGYVRKLLTDHDRAIGTVQRLVEMCGAESLDEEAATSAIQLVRSILPHVSDCDGLSIMVERLPDASVQAVLAARERALDAGLDLLRWAATVRGRRAIAPRS